MQTPAILFTAPRTVELAEIALPEPGAADLVVRTRVSGVSVGHHAGRYPLAIQNAIEYNGMI